MAGARVLVVEDEPRVRDLWLETLRDAGYTAEALDASPALGRLPELAPHLIILDMMMPEMDGFEFLARLRAQPGWANIPVLIVSALGDALRHAIDTAGARTLGLVGILTKPLPLEVLLDRVGRVIGPGATPPPPPT